jgi:type I restriction enzyme S subunit
MVLLKIDGDRFLPGLILNAIYARPTRAYFDNQLNGSTVGNLKLDRIAKIPLPEPPMEEQQQILAYLNHRCASIDTLISKAMEVIETLREYRSSLVTAAVTGKIDVRGAG